MDEIISEFLVESYEGLDRLDQNLVTLEDSPEDTETLTEVFRIVHTVKGTCGFLGFGQLEKVAHRGENLLSLLRDGVLSMNGEIADALLATVDAIRSILESIEETEEEGTPDNDALIAELERLSETAETPGAEAPPAAEEASVEAVGEEAPVQAEADEAPAEAAEEPAVEPALAATPEATQERIGDILVDDGSAARTDVEIAATEQSLGDARQIGKILVDEGRAEHAEVEKAASKQKGGAADSTIRVDVALLDTLMNLVGELVLSRNQIIQLASQTSNTEFVAPSQHLNLITSELQEGVMKTRMQPIGNVWGKLPRVVRDLSHQFGKQIRLETEGKDTELDRTILESIKDPLTHMVRNTVDHGIESPEDRIAAGKNPEGVLRLRANHQGGQVNIEIIDDGAGIDAERMRSIALSKGIITPEAAAKMSDAEAVQLIFKPGFSTAEKVSNVSGRGVGMDVVKTNIERIGGSVDIKTNVGKGTTFKIKIPLTLAIIPALTVTADDKRYAIPQLSLVELVRVDGADAATKIEDVHGAPVYRLRGDLLPIVDLREQLGFEPRDFDGVINIVVLQADDSTFGLVVDNIEDTEEIVVKPLGAGIKEIHLFSGATIMGDGKVALILDVLGLANESGVLSSESHGHEVSNDTQQASTDDSVLDARALLLVGFSDGARAAVPLAEVDRLEEFSGSEIEISDNQQVVQYRGGIMPVVDLASGVGQAPTDLDPEGMVSVVVCASATGPVGLAVTSIVDIVTAAEMHDAVGSGSETAIINEHVTDVVDIASVLSRFGFEAPTRDKELIGAGI